MFFAENANKCKKLQNVVQQICERARALPLKVRKKQCEVLLRVMVAKERNKPLLTELAGGSSGSSRERVGSLVGGGRMGRASSSSSSGGVFDTPMRDAVEDENQQNSVVYALFEKAKVKAKSREVTEADLEKK